MKDIPAQGLSGDTSKVSKATTGSMQKWFTSLYVLQLWSDLKEEGFSYLLTHKLNQDCIENFFSLDFDDLEDWSSDSRDDVTNGI